MATRIGMGLLAAFLALAAFSLILGSAATFQALEKFLLPGSYVATYSMPKYLVPHNGVQFAIGTVLLMLAALAANRASKKRNRDPGVVDQLLARGGIDFGLSAAAIVAVVALGWLVYRGGFQTEMHFSVKSAQAAFQEIGSYNIRVTGNTMYAAADGKVIQVAHLTPKLVRALDRAGMGVSAGRGNEYPIPGVLPIAGMLGIGGALWWLGRRSRRANISLSPRHAFLAFGLLNAYVVVWLMAARINVTTGAFHGFDQFLVFLLVILMASLFVFLYEKLSLEAPSLPSSSGWISAYMIASLAPIAWSYRFTAESPGSPAVIWLLAYACCAAGAWFAILWAWQREQRP